MELGRDSIRPAVSSTSACFRLRHVKERQPPSDMSPYVFFLCVQLRDAFSGAACCAQVELALA